MQNKKTITAFILNIFVQILNFVISCIGGKRKDVDDQSKENKKFEQDRQENKETLSKINDFIKKHTNGEKR